MKTLLVFPAILLLFLSAIGFAQNGDIQLDVRKHTLVNGMRILVLENHNAPVFTAVIRFNTGAIDERPGITGISHLLEHMLFKGTKIIGTNNYEAEVPIMNQIDSLAHLYYAEQVRLLSPLNPPDSTRLKELKQQIADLQAQQEKYIAKDELWETYLKAGGTGLNAGTNNDATQYFVSLPANRLELWTFLESDRMQNLILREFYSERDVVMEERRLSENNPRRALDEALSATMFWTSTYRWPVLGWMSDLQTILREDVGSYFKSHYSPTNAVAAIVGDVNADQVFALCEKYFGKIPAQPLPAPLVSRDAVQRGERYAEVEYDANPAAYIGWIIPQVGDPDLPALEALSNILSSGRTSRFYKNIKEKKLGTAGVFSANGRLPGSFTCTLTPMGEHTLAELETAVYAEIDKLKTEKVSDWELDKVRNQTDASSVRSLESNWGLAFRLADSETLTGDWHSFLDYRRNLKKVTADDIMRVANKYLTKQNRSVVHLVRTRNMSDNQPGPRKSS